MYIENNCFFDEFISFLLNKSIKEVIVKIVFFMHLIASHGDNL